MTFFSSISKWVGSHFVDFLPAKIGKMLSIKVIGLVWLFSLSLSVNLYSQNTCDIMRMGPPCVGETLTFVIRGSCTASSWTVSMGGVKISENATTLKVRWDSPVLNAEVGAVTDKGPAYSGYFDVKAVLHPSVSIATNDNGKCLGSPVKFTATPQNGGVQSNYDYTWKVNGITNPNFKYETFTSNTLQEGDKVTVTWYLATGVQCLDAVEVTSSPITMHFEVFPLPIVSQSEVFACQGESKSVTASTTKGNEIFRWYLAPSGGQPYYTGKTLTYTLPDEASHDFYVSNDMCDPLRTKVTFRTNPNDPITGSTSSCSPATGTVSVSSSLDVDGWEKSTNGGISWTSLGASKATTYSYSFTESTLIHAIVKKGICKVASQAATITVLKSVGGKPVANYTVNQCGNIQGTITLGSSRTGELISWYESIDKTNWKSIGNNDPIAFQVKDTTKYYYAVVKFGNCAQASSEIIAIQAKAYAGNVKVLSQINCHTATGSLELTEKYGEVSRWEMSETPDDLNTWRSIANSSNILYSFNNITKDTWFRAVVKLINCSDSAYSLVARVQVSNPPVGVLVRSETTGTCDSTKRPIIFKGQFKLKEYSGRIVRWEKYDGTGTWKIIDSTSGKISYDYQVSITTKFRVRLEMNGCDDIYSGEATFFVNPYYKGNERQANSTIKAYDGHSYISNGSIILGKGFRFHANSCQDFSITVDENYTLVHSNENFVLEETIKKEGIKKLDDVNWLGPNDRNSEYNYLDGLGRTMQKVVRKASPNQFDLVQPIKYDEIGRVEYEYMPYVDSTKDGTYKEDFEVRQREYYIKDNDAIANSMHPFARKVFDGSPLSRVTEKGSPGTAWQPLPVEGGGKTTKFQYLTNNETNIKVWKVMDSLPISTRNYRSGQLTVNLIIDERGRKIKDYFNKKGQIILRKVEGGIKNNDTLWVQTYFIYNEFDKRCFILSPEGVDKLQGNPSDDFLKLWAYSYRYDHKDRLIAKRIPGADWVYTFYDQGNRVRLTQDGAQRRRKEYTVMKYDGLSRPVLTAIWRDSLSRNRSQLLTLLNAEGQWYEKRSSTDPHGYTINKSFPFITESNLLTVTYYDDYSFLNTAYFNGTGYGYTAELGNPQNYNTAIKGSATGNKVKILKKGEAKWLRNVSYFDERYRPIQTIQENHIKGSERITSLFDFSGQLKKSLITHVGYGKTVKIEETFEHDNVGRLLTRKHKVDNNTAINLVQNVYNELGDLIEKNLHGTSTGSLQSLDYRYNIRGWLTNINNAALNTDGGITNDDITDVFGMELKYDNGLTIDPTKAQFNGNVSEVLWKNKSDNKLKGYSFTYDILNRLKDSQYRSFISNSWNNAESGRYNESIPEYDLNGNILTLIRAGINGYNNGTAKFGAMDSLVFKYRGNQLLHIKDKVPDIVMPKGFKPGDFSDGITDPVIFDLNNPATHEYKYNENGNLLVDKNKGIDSISYNLLNLPQKIAMAGGKYMTYTYDAGGAKLKKSIYDSLGNNIDSTDYVGHFEYHGGVLQHIMTGEGRIIPNGSKYNYEYFLKDHLGNVRAMVSADSSKAFEYVATMEREKASEEEGEFDKISETRQIDALNNHTPGGNESVRLNAAQGKMIGAAISLHVSPGDKISMEVFAKYIDQGKDYKSVVNNIATVLANVYTVGMGEGQKRLITNAFSSVPSIGFLQTENVPRAYLNYLFFDKNFNFIQGNSGYKQITTNARTDFEKLELTTTIQSDGYLYVYVANETSADVNVFFDDLKITQTEGPKVTYNDFYPFGMKHGGSQSLVSSPENKYLYQGKELQTDFELGVYDFEARVYNPVVPLTWQPDPLADKFYNISPYSWAGNNPMIFIDPTGMEVTPIKGGIRITGEEDLATAVDELNAMQNEGGDDKDKNKDKDKDKDKLKGDGVVSGAVVVKNTPGSTFVKDGKGGGKWVSTNDHKCGPNCTLNHYTEADQFRIMGEVGLFFVGGQAVKWAIKGGRWLLIGARTGEILAIGQRHHLLSNKIVRALSQHPTLRNLFNREDARFIYNAIDDAAHKGYQTWHRDYDRIVVEWLETRGAATADEFRTFLHNLHQQPWLRERIPNVNLLNW